MEDMPNDINCGDTLTLTGGDAAHITRVLRMKAGENVTVCDCRGFDYNCEILDARAEAVSLRVNERQPTATEPNVRITLFQGLPKGDKMELIVQKSVELGVVRIVPVITARSVSKPDEKSMAKKIERWNRIAAEAAGQSERGILPPVLPAMNFEEAAAMLSQADTSIMLYERNGGTLGEHLTGKKPDDIGIMIGPEGGFDETEVEYARSRGISTAGMGPRILRTETAPICALSVIMYATGNI
jgi:16S rRNA (uracil1498-N3)-methyltransferase